MNLKKYLNGGSKKPDLSSKSSISSSDPKRIRDGSLVDSGNPDVTEG